MANLPSPRFSTAIANADGHFRELERVCYWLALAADRPRHQPQATSAVDAPFFCVLFTVCRPRERHPRPGHNAYATGILRTSACRVQQPASHARNRLSNSARTPQEIARRVVR
jgi:hypothetical protein